MVGNLRCRAGYHHWFQSDSAHTVISGGPSTGWERCRRLLADELGTEPSTETEALRADLSGR